jgi:CRISPR/Cas system CMR subunit Cmr4 (Cas7 group RAMP superfamily)
MVLEADHAKKIAGRARKYDSLDDATPVRASKAIGAIDPVREMAVVFMLTTSAYLLRRYVRQGT